MEYDTYFVGKAHFQQLSDPVSAEYSGRADQEVFWKEFQGPYYGFDKVQLYNGHTKYPFTAGMHYRVWLKERGCSDQKIEELFNYKPTDSFREHGTWKIRREWHPSVFTSETAIAYLEERDASKPFAMWVSFSDPHDPHVVPEPYANTYKPEEVDYLGYKEGEHDKRPDCYNQLYYGGIEALPFHDGIGVPSAASAHLFGDEQYFREIAAVHHGMMKLMDEEIGKVLDKLKELGIYDNTMIIFTTDHGDYLGNHGYVYKGFPAFEEVYNVPLIIKNVNQKNGGTKTDALCSLVDIAPTILETAGKTAIESMHGISQVSVLAGRSRLVREFVIIENRPVREQFYQRMIVTDRYKLVAYMDSIQGELYDLLEDKNQYLNLWDNPQYEYTKKKLLECLFRYYDSARDEMSACRTAECRWNETELLLRIWEQMHSEEPVQERTCYS